MRIITGNETLDWAIAIGQLVLAVGFITYTVIKSIKEERTESNDRKDSK